jgi:UDP-galactopyranose mutase
VAEIDGAKRRWILKEKKTIVVGTGFSGGILARKIAEDLDLRVELIEKRTHIGGNMYDALDENGILIQRYGPHFLNTDKYFIIAFLEKYAELFAHCTKLLSFIDGKHVRLPFNFETVQQLMGAANSEKLLAKLRKAYGGRDRVPILELIDSADRDVAAYGNMLFEKAYKTYTAKQWGVPAEKIDKYVLDRVPMAMSYDERYLNKDFQYLPKHGFTRLFENLLDHPNIRLSPNTDALSHIEFDDRNKTVLYDGEKVDCLVFTGPIDELFSLRYGALPYRSLDIRYEYYETDSHLPCEIVSYPQADGYTRSTEYRKIMFDQSNCVGTVVATEYPLEYKKDALTGNLPYYPVLTEESGKVYAKYLELSKRYKNLFLCGRLAEFKYYNMDVCIEHALAYFEDIKKHILRDDA